MYLPVRVGGSFLRAVLEYRKYKAVLKMEGCMLERWGNTVNESAALIH